MSNLLIPGINIPKIVSPNKWSGGLRSTINSLGRDLTQTPMGGTVLSVGTDLLGNVLSGGNSTGIGNFMQGAGGIVGTVNPIAGAVVSGVGSLINGTFGSNINEDFVNRTRDRIDRQLAYTSNAQDFTGLMDDWNSFTNIDNVTKDQVGSDGLLSNKASRTTNALNKDIDNANFSAWNNISKLANDINTNSYLNNLAHFSAYGGPINMRYTGMMSPFGNQFGDGGGIYIKPSKRGTFTAAAKKHGKSVQAFASQVLANKENYSPAMIKKANFARNFGGRKRAYGGELTHGGIFSNNVLQINEGGTHQENPYDGIQLGVDEQGIPNLVEEGELIWDDYVFSNRIKVPKTVRQKYKLRDNITYAEAAKKLQKESEERPNDPISKNGLVAFMEELRNNQEEQRIKKEEKNNKYSEGGPLFNISLPEFPVLPDLPIYPELSGTSTQTGTSVRGIKQNPLRYAPIIGSAISVVNDMTGGNNPDYTNTDLFRNAIRTANRQVGYKPIGQYLRYEPLDTDYYASRLDSSTSSGRRAIQNTAGGNRAAALAGILGSDYNYITSLGQLARQAEEYNQAQKQRVAEFNRATDQYNSDLGTRVDMFNTENAIKQAQMYNSLATMRQSIYDRNRAERIANLTNFIQSLGDYGRESTDRDTLRWLADLGVVKYDTKGRYTGGKE